MKNVIKHSQPPPRNLHGQAQPHPDYCQHQYEVIAHELGAALKRCVKCRSLEAE
jgi:hypothetical protein